jgi:hypothetical protein
MIDSRLQRQRFEYKYITTELKAVAIRQFLESYLDVDAYGATKPDFSYPIHSIYLDSESLTTYRDTLNGNRNRYKLRVRYYENASTKPVYLEIKRRMDKIIVKKRAIVHRNAVDSILLGNAPRFEHLYDPTPSQFEALQSFCSLRSRLDAKPKVHVHYYREAYQSDELSSVRVTLDRHVNTSLVNHVDFSLNLKCEIMPFGDRVILELKFTDRFPRWFQDIVRTFDLRNESAAKYAAGLAILRHDEPAITGALE